MQCITPRNSGSRANDACQQFGDKNVFEAGKVVMLPYESRAYTAKEDEDPKTTVVKKAPVAVHLDAQT